MVVPRLNKLLLSRFMGLITKIKPTTGAHDQAVLNLAISETLKKFEILVEQQATYNPPNLFFCEVKARVTDILYTAFSNDNLNVLRGAYADLFLDIKNGLFEEFQDFYMSKIMQSFESPKNAISQNNFNVGVYSLNFKHAISTAEFPIAAIYARFYGLNKEYMFNTIHAITEEINVHILNISCAQVYQNIIYRKAKESVAINDAVALNSLWIIDQIELNLQKNIEGFNFECLRQQIYFAQTNAVDFMHVFEQYNKQFLASCMEDKNDLLLLLAITNPATLNSVPLNKPDILSSINPNLLLNAMLYISLSLAEDHSISMLDFIKCFSNNPLTVVQLQRSMSVTNFSFNGHDQRARNNFISVSSMSYMQQFILRITNHKLVYEIDPNFVAMCNYACANIEEDAPALTDVDSAQSSRVTSPINSPVNRKVYLPFFAAMEALQLSAPSMASNRDDPPSRKRERFDKSLGFI